MPPLEPSADSASESPTSQKTILVTGGAGLIGSHLCRRLIDAGERVVCLDSFSTGRRENVAVLGAADRFVLVEGDVADPTSMSELPDVDEIYNLACPASPVHYQRDPISTTRTSVLGAMNALALAERKGARILQASTSEVYGDPKVHPQSENYWGHVNPVGPRACYDEGKRCAETLFVDSNRMRGTGIRIARIFNTYGPNMQPGDGRAVSAFIVQALMGQPITVHGTGQQTRSFCYVDDLVTGLIRLMGAEGEASDLSLPVNLGRPVETSVLDLAKQVLLETGVEVPIVSGPLPADDPSRRCPDIRRAQKMLDWEPKIDLAVGLRATVHYFKGLLETTL